VTVVDAGVATELADAPGLVRAGIRKGTRNACVEDALTAAEVARALAFGAGLAAEAVADGAKVIALGEMGIGNTSAATLVAHAVAGIDLGVLTGPGAGLDAHGVDRKLGVLARAAARRPGPLEAADALAAFGGLEIAAMAGALIGAASRGAVVLVDGFIATSAALAALAARPEARSCCVFAHRSKEPGHRTMLDWLGVEPLIDLDLRLGEGTGALLALPLLRSACAMVNEMATFESARVSEKIPVTGTES
jgi:nicotinate-nucleotide--dimethylbenzimidazole phosphoribosyltransferase